MTFQTKQIKYFLYFSALNYLLFLSATVVLAGSKTWQEPLTGMQIISVIGGCFEMGDTFGDGFSDERPVRRICLDNFSIGKYEVTNGQYVQFLNTYSKKNEIDLSWIALSPKKEQSSGQILFNDGVFQVKEDRYGNYPVAGVSWQGAHEFADWLSKETAKKFRLPTEAEWEYAARSEGSIEKYPGSTHPDTIAWYEKNSGGSPHPVGEKIANGAGIHDMSGNVMEWCSDWWSHYEQTGTSKNPTGPSFGTQKVFRGGTFDTPLEYMRLTIRFKKPPARRDKRLGFRLAVD